MLWKIATQIPHKARSLRAHPGGRTFIPSSASACVSRHHRNQAALERQRAATTNQFSFKPNTVSSWINWCPSNIILLLFDLNFRSLRKGTTTSFSKAIKREMLTSLSYLTAMKSCCRCWWQRCPWTGFLLYFFNTLQKNFLCTLLFLLPL